MILLASTSLAANITGTVTGDDGAPIASVEVVAYDARLNYASARTTSTGAFAIGSLPPGRYRLRALPQDTDPHVDRFLPDDWDFCDADVIEMGAGETVSGQDFALPVGGTLSGRLVTSAGDPVPGQVLALGQSSRTALVSRLATTGADGTFEIVGLDSEPGASEPYAVYVAADGWPRQYFGPVYDDDEAALFDVTRGDASDARDQVLLDGISVAGTVYGPDGPVASGTVYAYSSSQVLAVSIAEDGTWIADGLPPGDVIPWAASDGLATTYWPDADRPGERIPVPDEGTAYTGADLTLPAEDTLTITLEGEGDLSEVSVLLYNDTYTVGRGGSLDETGTLVIDALYPGTYYLYVYGADVGAVDGFWADEAGNPRAISVDGDSAVTVSMPAGASFSGTVRGDDGEPVYGAYVYVTNFADGETEVAVTDADGAYTLNGLVGGTFTLRASYAHYCSNDQGWVTVYWPDRYVEEDAVTTSLADGEARTGVDFALPKDDDHDAMGDAWEADNGLDPARDDAAEDADEDGFTNVEEWLAGSDPTSPAAPEGCGSGCGGGGIAGVFLPFAAFARRRGAVSGQRWVRF